MSGWSGSINRTSLDTQPTSTPTPAIVQEGILSKWVETKLVEMYLQVGGEAARARGGMRQRLTYGDVYLQEKSTFWGASLVPDAQVKVALGAPKDAGRSRQP